VARLFPTQGIQENPMRPSDLTAAKFERFERVTVTCTGTVFHVPADAELDRDYVLRALSQAFGRPAASHEPGPAGAGVGHYVGSLRDDFASLLSGITSSLPGSPAATMGFAPFIADPRELSVMTLEYP
jgi:hypothetical protein